MNIYDFDDTIYNGDTHMNKNDFIDLEVTTDEQTTGTEV